MEGVLTEIVGGIDQDRVTRNPECQGALCRRHDLGDHICDDVVVADTMRAGARNRATRVRADDPGTSLGSNQDEVGIRTRPRVVDQVGAFAACQPRDAAPPGVDADDQLGVLGSDRGDERNDSPDLFVGVDEVTGPSFHSPDVHQIGAFSDSPIDGSHRCRIRERRALVVEGIGSAVDDGHHQCTVDRDRTPTQGGRRTWLRGRTGE